MRGITSISYVISSISYEIISGMYVTFYIICVTVFIFGVAIFISDVTSENLYPPVYFLPAKIYGFLKNNQIF